MKYIDVDRLRAEIERRQKSLRAGICNEEVFTKKQRNEMLVASEELDRLSRFLSTLELETNKDEKVPIRIYLGSKYEFIRRDIILKEIEGMKKNNEVSDNKEYASYELDVACGYDMACDDILSFLKAFAEADKHPKNILAPSKECDHGLREPLESEKPVPADLEEKSEKPTISDKELLAKEISRFLSNAKKMGKGEWRGKYPISEFGFGVVAQHFYEMGLNARRK